MASELYYLRARYYDPSIGRFMTQDPFRGWVASPQSQNRYAYVTNKPSCDDYDPAWSPDGSKIAYGRHCTTSGEYEIGVMSASGTALATASWGNCERRHPTWSPDGSWVAFQLRCGTSDDWDIGKNYAAGGSWWSDWGVATGPGNDRYPDWSPDGSKIAYSSDQDGDDEIYTMNPDGTGQTYFFDHPAMDLAPSWSADGSKIAFFSDRDFPFQIYVMKADGTGLTRLKSNAADTLPDWR